MVDHEWLVGQIVGEASINDGWILPAVHDLGQFVVHFAIRIHLQRVFRFGLGDALSTRKLSVQIVETMVFKIDDNDMSDLTQFCSRGGGCLRMGQAAKQA